MIDESASPESVTSQSLGDDPKAKRNSVFLSFFKWLKPSSSSRESLNEAGVTFRRSSSSDSLNSIASTGTVTSFSFVDPASYNQNLNHKKIHPGPETDTYRARLKERDTTREKDKNVTLRKKYNLFFNRDSLFRSNNKEKLEESTKSLPLMTKTKMEVEEEQQLHRRTISESSKIKKAGAYLHVKGKRKAPQPPCNKIPTDPSSTLRRKKRNAPPPPLDLTEAKLLDNNKNNNDIIFHDTLKLDHGILRNVKDSENLSRSINEIHYEENAVSPGHWYKRNSNSNLKRDSKIDQKYEPIDIHKRNSAYDFISNEFKYEPTDNKKKDDKRKSGLSLLANISELDREAAEILEQKHKEENDYIEMPEFMKPKPESKLEGNSWKSPKRRTAKDLIAKFNAITNVTKVTVNTALFGGSQDNKRDYFGRSISHEDKKQESILETHKKRIEMIDKKANEKSPNPLMKSESASAVKKPETPKTERKPWNCPKCYQENEYWRIICHVCSTIKPYFDDLASSPKKNKERKEIKPKFSPITTQLALERSKTQIGFSALATYNANKNKSKSEHENEVKEADKKEEREKLKKMLIEMKNSLPKRKCEVLTKQISRSSIILENLEPESLPAEEKTEEGKASDLTNGDDPNNKVLELIVGTVETIYENIKVKKGNETKPIKVSSSAQTSNVVRKSKDIPPEISDLLKKKDIYEPMRLKDFEDIYYDRNGKKSAARIYSNLIQNDELALFFNLPKNVIDKYVERKDDKNTDTIEINRLLKRLEIAISKGDLTEAALYAKELAQLKVNCSVIRQKAASHDKTKMDGIRVEMYVEDKVSHRGPFQLQVTPNQTVLQLKQQVQKEFDIPVNVQRWILGKELANDDKSTLKSRGITKKGCPIFLYLVAPENFAEGNKPTPSQDQPSQSNILKNQESEFVTNFSEAVVTTTAQVFAPKVISAIPKSQNVEALEKIKTNINVQQEALKKSRKNSGNSNINIITTNNAISQQEKLKEIVPDAEQHSKNVQSSRFEDSKPSCSNQDFKKKLITQKSEPVSFNFQNYDKLQRSSSESRNSAPSGSKLGNGATAIYKLKSDEAASKSGNDDVEFANSIFKDLLEQVNSATDEFDKELNKFKRKDTDKEVADMKGNNDQAKTPVLDLTDDTNSDSDYDTHTLKPQVTEWECHLCTLLNSVKSNVCAVCATVRQRHYPKKSQKKKAPKPKLDNKHPVKPEQTYLQLLDLDNTDLVTNSDQFECVVCFTEIPPKEGVTLRECLHQFCKECLRLAVEFCEDAEVKCPYRDENYSCDTALQDREIKALVSLEVYNQFLAKSVIQAENMIDKSFHCKTPDCTGWCIFEDNVNEFRCPVCKKVNCLTCQVIHMGANCKEYQERMCLESEVDEDARRTKAMLNEMVSTGEALNCPTCHVIMMKKWGCDWLRCSMCKTEICWVTRGPRWGPAGKGDTSGGCKCGVNGVKCHPKCNYCH